MIIPCAARPSTDFFHLNSPCECFVGGQPPQYQREAPRLRWPFTNNNGG